MQSCGRPFHSQNPPSEPYRRRMSLEEKKAQLIAFKSSGLPKSCCALLKKPTHANQAALYKDLKKYGRSTGLCWLLSPAP